MYHERFYCYFLMTLRAHTVGRSINYYPITSGMDNKYEKLWLVQLLIKYIDSGVSVCTNMDTICIPLTQQPLENIVIIISPICD